MESFQANAGASSDSNPPLRWGYHRKVTFLLTVGGSMRGDGLAFAASAGCGAFLRALPNLKMHFGVFQGGAFWLMK
ncbi:hypothetical protein C1I60_17565 [Paenibacillus terrae]|uniref:Uncharacterized protein n=1 Tax=Paenibacillus terrae TaxID=159743 RepID=A0A4U2PSE8_9BACL|nr:hypothetical protein [Paenibacillus terrae]TKH42602.1 hypothetical protein C1I60_17565 [Paenibacillus terrae]